MGKKSCALILTGLLTLGCVEEKIKESTKEENISDEYKIKCGEGEKKIYFKGKIGKDWFKFYEIKNYLCGGEYHGAYDSSHFTLERIKPDGIKIKYENMIMWHANFAEEKSNLYGLKIIKNGKEKDIDDSTFIFKEAKKQYKNYIKEIEKRIYKQELKDLY